MDIKNLYVIAIVVASVSGGYYYFGGKGKKLEVDSAKSMIYSAEDIHLTQTDGQGLVSVKAEADRLEQDTQKNISRLNNLHAYTFKLGQPDANFYAKRVNSYDDNSKVVLLDQVIATRLLDNGEKMTFTTTELTGYPKTKDLVTDKMVTIESSQANLVSKGMKANFNDGQYEFFNIRGTYER